MHAEDGEVLELSQAWTSLTGYSIIDVPTFDAWLTRAYGEGAGEVRQHMQELITEQRSTLRGRITGPHARRRPPLLDFQRFVAGNSKGRAPLLRWYGSRHHGTQKCGSIFP
jgi:hypothetical protein